MSHLTTQEYLELCERLAEQYYNQEDDYEQNIPDENWIPAESEAKEKLKRMINHNGFIDLTNAKQSQIANKVHTANNFKVGAFLVKITKYKVNISGDTHLDIIIYEEKLIRNKFFKDTKISVKVDPTKDMRFSTRNWAGYFKTDKKGMNVPMGDFPEIIRWLQAVQKMKAFL
jgi:hypothetical protein